MREFKSKTKPEHEQVEQFVSGAGTRQVETRPWAELDPDAKPSRAITLRLNEYELAILRAAAKKERRSVQSTIKVLLIPAAITVLEA
jgi:hypothetical protein